MKEQSLNSKPRMCSRERSAPTKSQPSNTSGFDALAMSTSNCEREIV